MATLTVASKYSLSGAFTNVGALTTPNEPIAITKPKAYTSGSAANQADEFVANNRSVAAAPEQIDLTSTLANAFGDVVSFTKIREIIIHNRSTTSGEQLTLSGNVLDGMSAGSGGSTTQATGTLTFTTNPLNGETVTIDSKTYTFQTTLTDVDGNVLIGASATITAAYLAAAIILSSGAGSTYAASTTIHPTVRAGAVTNTILASAITGPTRGNAIATTETLSDGSWGGATLSGGTGPEEFVDPDGRWHRSSPIDGFVVTNGSQDLLNVDPGASDTISYDIIVVGVT